MDNLIDGRSSDHCFGLPIDPNVLFSNHRKEFKPSIEKRQTKLLEKLSFLKPFLWEDEKIVCVTTGCSPMSILEQWLMGLWIFYIKRCLLVFTNERILHIPTKVDYSYRNSLAQIVYADCQSVAVKGSTLLVKYANNTKERYYYIGSKERKKIKSFLGEMPFQAMGDTTQTRTHLCPRCTGELVEDVYTCPHCNLEFKSNSEARKISIIYPGGGYFYTRHPLLGLSDACVEVTLTAVILTSLINAIGGAENGDFTSVVFLAIVLAIEKAVTVYDSNKFIREYIPAEKEIHPLEQSPAYVGLE